MSLRKNLSQTAREHLQAEAERVIAASIPESGDLAAELAGVRRAVEQLRETISALATDVEALATIRRDGFSPEMTVHAAWRAHEAARIALGELGHTACDSCPVGADETLGEVIEGARGDREAFFERMNSLL